MEAQESVAVEEVIAGRRLARPSSALPSPPVTEPPPVAVPAVVEPESVESLRDAFQREYLALLLKPEVVAAVERHLRKKKNSRDAIEMFKAIVAGLQPADTKNTVHARNITVVSRLARPPKGAA